MGDEKKTFPDTISGRGKSRTISLKDGRSISVGRFEDKDILSIVYRTNGKETVSYAISLEAFVATVELAETFITSTEWNNSIVKLDELAVREEK